MSELRLWCGTLFYSGVFSWVVGGRQPVSSIMALCGRVSRAVGERRLHLCRAVRHSSPSERHSPMETCSRRAAQSQSYGSETRHLHRGCLWAWGVCCKSGRTENCCIRKRRTVERSTVQGHGKKGKRGLYSGNLILICPSQQVYVFLF